MHNYTAAGLEWLEWLGLGSSKNVRCRTISFHRYGYASIH